jgi:hypothetical protein
MAAPDFRTGDSALFFYLDEDSRERSVMVTVRAPVTIDGAVHYIIAGPRAVLSCMAGQVIPCFFGTVTRAALPVGWTLSLVEPDELEPPRRILNLVF